MPNSLMCLAVHITSWVISGIILTYKPNTVKVGIIRYELTPLSILNGCDYLTVIKVLSVQVK